MMGDGRAAHMRAWGSTLLLLVALSGVASCSTWNRLTGRSRCGVVPVPTAALRESGNLRARMRISAGSAEIGMEVVSRYQEGALVIVGLSPYGTRIFAATQRDRDVTVDVEDARVRKLAMWTVDALHRALLIPRQRPQPTPQRGEPQGPKARDIEIVEFVWSDERVRDAWVGGQHRSRDFLRGSGAGDVPGVSIQYAAESVSERSERIDVHNAWCGYDAVVSVLSAPSESNP